MLTETLMRFGYTQREAHALAIQIYNNLENYLKIQEKVRQESDRLRTTKQSNSGSILESLNRKRNHGR
jgi:hypothetical protein